LAEDGFWSSMSIQQCGSTAVSSAFADTNRYYDPFPPAPEFLSRARQDFDPLLYKHGSRPAWAHVLVEPACPPALVTAGGF